MTDSLLAATFPVFKLDGSVVGDLARDILRLEIDDSIDGLRTAKAIFTGVALSGSGDVEPLVHLDGSDLDFGKKLEISIGAPGNERIVFTGLISAVEVEHNESDVPVVTAYAEDALMKLRMTRRLKTYEQMSDADIAQDIASQHGLSADTDADGPTYDVVQQWNQSDLAFLRTRAALIQAEVWADDDKLCFKSRTSRTGTSLTLVQGGDLMSVRLRADLAHQRTSVKVSGYDASSRDQIEEESGSDAIQAEASGGTTGPALLQKALGESVSHRVRAVPLVDGEAQSFAKAEQLRRARSFVTADGVTTGTPDLIVGSQLTLQRVGDAFEGAGYYATRVLHAYDLINGFRTHFHAERSTLGGSL
ncbi:MAG TPA: contractile injection system protein, VgrG/Pvc8 family [Gaiellaceae bacterium]|nr:contractile injection system protein, VgrG/Pvc8 family [Gaiellaceae bacterium]